VVVAVEAAAVAEVAIVVAMVKKLVLKVPAAPKANKEVADAAVNQLTQIILRCCFKISYFGTTFFIFTLLI
jgi:hypothetical protein